MVAGVGCDILLLSSIAKESLEKGSAFVTKVFTKEEQQEGFSREKSELYFKTRFCGKEAVFKSLHMDGNHIRLNEIEVLCDQYGAPMVKLYGKLKKAAEDRGIYSVLLSLSYDGDYAMAYAIAQTSC